MGHSNRHISLIMLFNSPPQTKVSGASEILPNYDTYGWYEGFKVTLYSVQGEDESTA